MPLRTKFVLASLILISPAVILGATSMYLLDKISKPLHQDIPQQVAKLSKSSKLGEKALYIRYYDEVLTQSARNYAYTGNVAWKNRYLAEVPKLDAVIKEALAEGDEQDLKDFGSIEQANLALVDMETRAMALVDAKNLSQAQRLLDSPEYSNQKEIYQTGLIGYAQRRGLELDKAVVDSAKALDDVSQKTAQLTTAGMLEIGVILGASIILSVCLSVFLSRLLLKPLEEIKSRALNIAKGKYDDLLVVNTQDEVGQLAEAINTMSQELHQSKVDIEARVEERTKELEKLTKFMVNRELKMAELKEQLRQGHIESQVQEVKSIV